MSRSSHLALVASPSVGSRHHEQREAERADREVSPMTPPHVQAARDFLAARERLGWSQDRVAIRLGVARGTVIRWERGVDPTDITATPVPGWAIVALERHAA